MRIRDTKPKVSLVFIDLATIDAITAAIDINIEQLREHMRSASGSEEKEWAGNHLQLLQAAHRRFLNAAQRLDRKL